MRGAEAELGAESRRALWHQTETRRREAGCSECGSGGEGPDSFLSNAETPSRRHLHNKTKREKIRDTISASQVMEDFGREDESSPRGAKTPEFKVFTR